MIRFNMDGTRGSKIAMQRLLKTSIVGIWATTTGCLVGLLVPFFVLASCRSRTCEGPSSDSEVAKCVSRYSRPRLTPADIRRFVEHGRSECFVRGDPKKLAEQGRCLPLSLGVDARNGKALEIVYGCSDICPDAGGVYIRYAKVSRKDCCAIGAYPIPAWGGHGCAPPEVSLLGLSQIAYYPRYPGRPWEPGTRSPCDPKLRPLVRLELHPAIDSATLSNKALNPSG